MAQSPLAAEQQQPEEVLMHPMTQQKKSSAAVIQTAFSPFRAMGCICSEIPVSYTLLYGEPVIMAATGKTFLLYRGKELSLLRGGPTFERDIACVAQSGRFRFVGEGPFIHAFSHHKALWTQLHATVTKARVELLVARDDLLFSVGADHMVVVRSVRTGEVLNEFPVVGSEHVNCVVIPEGYDNKLLLGTAAGHLHLYNFRTGKLLLVHRVAGSVSEGSSSFTNPVQVLCLASSVYRDIIAYGTSSGKLVVFNLAQAQDVCSFFHEGVAVTSCVFRTDKDGMIASGTSAGEIAVWDVANRCLDGVLTRSKEVKSRLEAFDTPHTEGVHSLLAFPQGAMVVSAAGDNAMMQFRFDTVDGLGLLVRERRGHMGECTAVKFYNTDLLVTAGADQSLRVTHVFSDRASWELSQGKLGRRGRTHMVGRETLKLPAACKLDAATARNYQWGSVVSLHEGSAMMCSWRMDTRCLENKLSGISTGVHTARCVVVSACGNFAVVGYSSGHVTVINLQNKSIKQLNINATATAAGGGRANADSGSTAAPSSPRASTSAVMAHEKSVEAVEVACGNSVVVSAGLDGKMILWDLLNCKHIRTVTLGEPVTMSCIHEPSSLFIAAQQAEHSKIAVYSCHPDAEEPSRPVRVFIGHQAPITAMVLTPDTQRHVVSASADGALLVWDLAAGVCVGMYSVAAPITSLSFHPDALFLATTHRGENGSFLWTNNLRYGFAPEVVLDPLSTSLTSVPALHFPVSRGEGSDEATDSGAVATAAAQQSATSLLDSQEGECTRVDLFDAEADIALTNQARQKQVAISLNNIECSGLKVSGLPRSVWVNVTVIDQIKEKNQPLLPPKKRDVPFFLSTTSELRPTFIVQQQQNAPAAASSSSRLIHDLGSFTPIQGLIMEGKFEEAMDALKPLSAREIDLEIRSMIGTIEDGVEYTLEERRRIQDALVQLIRFFAHHLQRVNNVDLLQGMLAAAMKAHGALFMKAGPVVKEELAVLGRLQREAQQRLQHLIAYPNCLLGTFTGSVI